MPDATGLPAVPAPDPLDPAYLLAVGFLGSFLNANTREAYRLDLRIWFEWCAAHRMPTLQATRAHVQAFVVHLLEQRRNAAQTVVRRIGTVSGFYDYCVVDGHLAHSPAHHLRLPKVHDDPSRRTWLTRFELGAVMRAAKASKSPADLALVSLLGTIGMRVSAVCAVDLEDLSTTEGGYRMLRTIGKGDKPSLKVLPVPVVLAVERAAGGRTSGPLLLRRDGSRMNRRSADAVVTRLCRAAGVDKEISPHSFRRSFATLALQAGVPAHVVQAGMDHASIRTTMIYDRLGVEPHAAAAHTVAAMLASAYPMSTNVAARYNRDCTFSFASSSVIGLPRAVRLSQ